MESAFLVWAQAVGCSYQSCSETNQVHKSLGKAKSLVFCCSVLSLWPCEPPVPSQAWKPQSMSYQKEQNKSPYLMGQGHTPCVAIWQQTGLLLSCLLCAGSLPSALATCETPFISKMQLQHLALLLLVQGGHSSHWRISLYGPPYQSILLHHQRGHREILPPALSPGSHYCTGPLDPSVPSLLCRLAEGRTGVPSLHTFQSRTTHPKPSFHFSAFFEIFISVTDRKGDPFRRRR